MVVLAAMACEGGIDADTQAGAVDSESGFGEPAAPEGEVAAPEGEVIVEEGPRADDSIGGLRGNDGPQLAPVFPSKLKSTKVLASGGLSGTHKIDATWNNSDLAGYSWVRQVAFGTSRYLFLMESQSGAARVYNINTDNTLGSLASSPIFAKTWTGVEIGKHGSTTYLYLHNSDSGELRRHVFNSDGTINTAINDTVTHADWRDISNFSGYQIGTTMYLEGLDAWNGKNRVYTGDLTSLTSDTWTPGWTSMDHMTFGSLGYMLTYKSAGDPNSTANDATEVGRLAIRSIDSSGTKTLIYDDNTVGGGWTSARFLTVWDTATTTKPWIVFYNANTGAYAFYGFSTATGLGALQGSGTTTLWAGDVEAYTTASETFLLLLDEENRPLLDPGKAKKTGMCVQQQLTTPVGHAENVVGFQFGLSQFGRSVYRRAFGHSSVTPLVGITTRTRQNVGSISKIITALTVMELADRGEVDLDSTVKSNLSATEYAGLGAGWTDRVTVRDLLRHQSGLANVNCSVTPSTLKSNCTTFFNTGQNDAGAPCEGSGTNACNRDYENGNFVALREVIENAENVFDSPGIEQATRDLWATALGIGGITCQESTSMWYFDVAGSCDTPGVDNCVTAPDGTNRLQLQYNVEKLNRYSDACSAGGWHASVQELLRFMAGVMYGKVLSPTFNDQLMDMTLTAPDGRTAIGWGTGEQPEDPWAGPAADQMTLDKGGSLNPGIHTTMGTLPDQAAYVLLINSQGSDKRSVVKRAYQFGIGQRPTCDDMW